MDYDDLQERMIQAEIDAEIYEEEERAYLAAGGIIEYPEPHSIDDPTWFGINRYSGDRF